MLRGFLGLVLAGAVTLFAAATFQHGYRDALRSATHWGYFPVRDMRTSIVINPQKTVLLAPDTASVPVTGIDRAIDRDVAAATMVNPTVPADLDSSVARGARKFAKTCVPCHGPSMLGDGPVAAKFMPPPDLLAEATRNRKDGYLYSYIRHGGVVMPSYGAAVTAREAWDLVNYVRHMQKVAPR